MLYEDKRISLSPEVSPNMQVREHPSYQLLSKLPSLILINHILFMKKIPFWDFTPQAENAWGMHLLFHEYAGRSVCQTKGMAYKPHLGQRAEEKNLINETIGKMRVFLVFQAP